MNSTTDPALRSWIDVPAQSHFPIQNLPYGAFVRADGTRGVGVAIGEHVLDLKALAIESYLSDPYLPVFREANLNAFLALGQPAWKHVRSLARRLLGADESELRDNAPLREK